MECMCAQTRPRLILSSERLLGGMESEPMLPPREKISCFVIIVVLALLWRLVNDIAPANDNVDDNEDDNDNEHDNDTDDDDDPAVRPQVNLLTANCDLFC